MRALVKLTTKLEEMNQSPEFTELLRSYVHHGGIYLGPTWEAELREARAALAEAKQLSGQ